MQAGGQGSRMDVLTRERAKPVLPYGGTHRLIDFVLSSLANSGLVDVWVSVEYQVASIDDYLSGGRPWSLDRNRGGFRRMVPLFADCRVESGARLTTTGADDRSVFARGLRGRRAADRSRRPRRRRRCRGAPGAGHDGVGGTNCPKG